MSDIAAHGPIDFVLLEFPGDIPLAECAAELEAILDTGAVALYTCTIARGAPFSASKVRSIR